MQHCSARCGATFQERLVCCEAPVNGGCSPLVFGSIGAKMFYMRIVHESVENIEAVFPRSRERIAYQGLLRVLDSGASPVRLELSFVPPHPFCCNMPESHSIRGQSVTEVYVKLARFLRRNGCEFGR
jgi:hypothetical protein